MSPETSIIMTARYIQQFAFIRACLHGRYPTKRYIQFSVEVEWILSVIDYIIHLAMMHTMMCAFVCIRDGELCAIRWPPFQYLRLRPDDTLVYVLGVN